MIFSTGSVIITIEIAFLISNEGPLIMSRSSLNKRFYLRAHIHTEPCHSEFPSFVCSNMREHYIHIIQFHTYTVKEEATEGTYTWSENETEGFRLLLMCWSNKRASNRTSLVFYCEPLSIIIMTSLFHSVCIYGALCQWAGSMF